MRDSAGITIVENVAADSAAWRWWLVPAAPELQIGTVDGEGPASLHRVVGVVRLSDGRIAVANGGSSDIRLFDASGRHAGTLGRAGGAAAFGRRPARAGRHAGGRAPARLADDLRQRDGREFGIAAAAAGGGGELLVHDLDGRLTRIVQTGVVPGPVTDSDLAAHITRVTADLPPERRDGVRAGLEGMPRVAGRPAHGPLVIADNGDLLDVDHVRVYRLEATR